MIEVIRRKAEEFNKGKDHKKIAKYYIAYGSNMDLNQMRYRVKDSILIDKGFLEDYRLEFRARYATVKEEKGFRVPVIIFGISEEDEIKLDRYEGYPSLYYKKNVIAKDSNHIQRECMVYIMEKNYKYELPSVEYYLNMEESYNSYCLPKDILERSLIDSYKNISIKRYDLVIEENGKIVQVYSSENLEELKALIESDKKENLRYYIYNNRDELVYFVEKLS